jgi:hypothetical protein
MGVIATNAQPILDARKRGLAPAGLVIVSLIGQICEQNHTVYANPQKAYDWRWVHGLKICIYAVPDVQWQATTRSIAYARPSWLGLWDAVRHEGTDVLLLPHIADIEKPKSEWRWNLDFLPWLRFQNEEFVWN